MEDQFVYRLATEEQWLRAQKTGTIQLTDLDNRDGFIHLSTAGQIILTANLHFTGHLRLWALLFDRGDLEDKLKWEKAPNRWDKLPHYYGDLGVGSVRKVLEMKRRPGGSFGIVTKGAL